MRQEIFYTFLCVLYVIYAFLCISVYCFSFFIYYANIKNTYVRIY